MITNKNTKQLQEISEIFHETILLLDSKKYYLPRTAIDKLTKLEKKFFKDYKIYKLHTLKSSEIIELLIISKKILKILG